jgi:hypothetical protein
LHFRYDGDIVLLAKGDTVLQGMIDRLFILISALE